MDAAHGQQAAAHRLRRCRPRSSTAVSTRTTLKPVISGIQSEFGKFSEKKLAARNQLIKRFFTVCWQT
jgi:hypothetical protein